MHGKSHVNHIPSRRIREDHRAVDILSHVRGFDMQMAADGCSVSRLIGTVRKVRFPAAVGVPEASCQVAVSYGGREQMQVGNSCLETAVGS